MISDKGGRHNANTGKKSSPEGEISIDFTGKKSGRGAYLCANEQCLAKARKTKQLERALETAIPDEVYEKLEHQLAQGSESV